MHAKKIPKVLKSIICYFRFDLNLVVIQMSAFNNHLYFTLIMFRQFIIYFINSLFVSSIDYLFHSEPQPAPILDKDQLKVWPNNNLYLE